MKVLNLIEVSVLALCSYDILDGLFCRQGTFHVAHLPTWTVDLQPRRRFSDTTGYIGNFQSHFQSAVRVQRHPCNSCAGGMRQTRPPNVTLSNYSGYPWPSFRASVASRGISILRPLLLFQREIPRFPSVATLLSVIRNDDG